MFGVRLVDFVADQNFQVPGLKLQIESCVISAPLLDSAPFLHFKIPSDRGPRARKQFTPLFGLPPPLALKTPAPSFPLLVHLFPDQNFLLPDLPLIPRLNDSVE